ncbi:hypothetical protein [Clostridium sp. CCUG 7971]|uniref:hypothetical protein n=1 Tax=Clostridium sp. CCUG 7971 TaxID=2811414 RepID=UPI001ABB76F4|nr:hypothetical protein [Clostridium sp. CCUG 7971]MBO3443858.1 hypothetical protein [Clostridium sp. CCUG 7971]
MDIFLKLSTMQISLGITLFTAGIMVRKSSEDDNKKGFFNKIKNQGISNTILGMTAWIMQYLNKDLTIISIILFAVGTLFTFIYLIVNLILLVKNISTSKTNKIIIIIGVVVISIYMFFGDSIIDKLEIGFRKFNEPITVGKEFLFYKCDNKSHGSEKIYMTINKIEKDEDSCTVMDFNLRYEGNQSIKLIDEGRSFSDLCSFTTNLSSDKLEDGNWSDDFVIEDDMNSGVIHSEYTNKLPKVIKPGTTLNNLTHPVAIMGVRYDNIPVKDINIEIETKLKIQHDGKKIRENINK